MRDKHNNKSEQTAFSEFLSIRYLDESKFNGIGSTDLVANLVSKIQEKMRNRILQGETQKEKKNEGEKVVQKEQQLLNISGVATKSLNLVILQIRL